jgi:hypothetical protein
VYFNTTADSGNRIVCYYVPDSFSGAAVIRIVRGGGESILLPANDIIPSLVAAGRHETGQCGFVIDETLIPDLATAYDLEIHEPETGLRLYRRRPPGTSIQAKILRLETHLVPLGRLDAAFEPAFQYFYGSIERFGHETVAQILLLEQAESFYASGRFLYKPYEYYIDSGGFRSICMLRDPCDELAERLLTLKSVSEGKNDHLDARDALMFEDAVRFVAALDFSDEKQLRRAFRNISAADASIFSDPVVRILSARTPDEAIKDAAISQALEILSTFAVVGLRAHPKLFVESLAALLEADPGEMPVLDESPAVTELGRTLRDIGTVRLLIERDLELYAQVRTALEGLM